MQASTAAAMAKQEKVMKDQMKKQEEKERLEREKQEQIARENVKLANFTKYYKVHIHFI